MDPVSTASVVVAVIAAVASGASQRAAAKAAVKNTEVTSRVDMEREAYSRARAFDTETIRRQDEELAELRLDNKNLYDEIRILRERIQRLERGLQENIEELLHERLREPDAPRQPNTLRDYSDDDQQGL